MRRLGAVIVVTGCVYETAAITTGKIPTITHLSWKLREKPVGKAIIWATLGALAWHFFVDNVD
jgi:hypothetical protein